MSLIILVMIIAIVSIIFWHKKINPETSWIYTIYVAIILVIYLSAVKVL